MIHIRVDCNNEISTGHLMRCLAIADEARRLGTETEFVIADENPVSILRSKGYPYFVLNSVWNDVDSELDDLKKYINDRQVKVLLIDSYQVTDNYLRELKSITGIVYIDDLNRFFYPVDVLICYGVYFKEFHYEEIYKDTELLLGTEYVPLRSAFSEIIPKQISKRIDRILILSGGTDEHNAIMQCIDALDDEKYKEVVAVCGMYNVYYKGLQKRFSHTASVRIIQSVSNIESYMKNADLVISAGGTTLYELCAMGVPTISYSIADNQLLNVKAFDREGIISYAGDVRTDSDWIKRLKNIILEYDDCEIRSKRSQKMRQLVDGKGAKRIAEILMKKE